MVLTKDKRAQLSCLVEDVFLLLEETRIDVPAHAKIRHGQHLEIVNHSLRPLGGIFPQV
jgi:hypothetical protein